MKKLSEVVNARTHARLRPESAPPAGRSDEEKGTRTRTLLR